jgi:hypothetical protein
MTVLSSLATVTATFCAQYLFKIAVLVQNPAKCVVRATIRFLRVKGETYVENYCQLLFLFATKLL